MDKEEIIKLLKKRLEQLLEDEKQIKAHLSTKQHPEWFTNTLLDILTKIKMDCDEIFNKIRNLEKK